MGNQGLCNKHYADHHCHCLPGPTNRFDQELNLAPLINPFSTTCIISINRLQHIDFDSACALHPDCDTRSQKGPEGIVGRGNGALVGLVFPSSFLHLPVSLSVSGSHCPPGVISYSSPRSQSPTPDETSENDFATRNFKMPQTNHLYCRVAGLTAIQPNS